LLKLPDDIQADLRTGRLTMGHARALLSLPSAADQLKLREEILAHSWSVRTTEADVQKKRAAPARRGGRRSAELAAIEDALRSALASRVRIIGNERAGRIEISYSSAEELDRLAELISGARG
jgi:ParB family chromosome partitioning protein